MSISESLEGTAEILLESALPIQFEVVDSEYRTVIAGVGTLSATIAPGIYQVWRSLGDQSRSSIVAIRPNARHEDRQVWMDFDTAAPLEGSRTYDEVHARIVATATDTAAAHEGVAAPVIIVLRNLCQEPAQDGWTAELLDSGLSPVAQNLVVENNARCTSVTAFVEPGGYVLAIAEGEAKVKQYLPLWLGDRVQTLVFLCRYDQVEAPLVSVHMIERYARWARQDNLSLCIAEILQQEFATDKVDLPADLGSLLARAEKSPSLALSLAATLAVAEQDATEEIARLSPVLTKLLADAPDVRALIPTANRSLALPFPPMFDLATDDGPALDYPEGSLARKIAPVLLRYGPFNSWLMPATSSLEVFLEEAASQLVHGYLSLHPSATGSPTLGRLVADQTGLSVQQVERVLDRDTTETPDPTLRIAVTEALTELAVWEGHDEVRTVRTGGLELSLRMLRRGSLNSLVIDSLVSVRGGMPLDSRAVDLVTSGLIVTVKDSTGNNRVAQFTRRMAAWTSAEWPVSTAIRIADSLRVLGNLAVGIETGREPVPEFSSAGATRSQRTIFEDTGVEIVLSLDTHGHASVTVVSREPEFHQKFALLRVVAGSEDEGTDLAIPLTWLTSAGIATGRLNLGTVAALPQVFVVPSPIEQAADVGLDTLRRSQGRAADRSTERALLTAIRDLLAGEEA